MNVNFHFFYALKLAREALMRAEKDVEEGDRLDEMQLVHFRHAVAEFGRIYDVRESVPADFIEPIDTDIDSDGDDLDDIETESESWSAASTDDEGHEKRAVSVEDAGKNCAICTADYRPPEQVRTLPCKHYYHVGCIDEWLKVAPSCPLCKTEV